MSEGPATIRIIADSSSASRARAYRRSHLPDPWEHGRDQQCDEQCVCPVHGTPLIYWPAGNDHACQNADCRYGHGMKDAAPVRPVSGEETSG
jgi:hypothetical protein